MSPWHPTRTSILQTLADAEPKSSAEIATLTGKSSEAVGAALSRCWKKNLVLRSKRRFSESLTTFKGRAGMRRNLRSFYLYTLGSKNSGSLPSGNCGFVSYKEWVSDSNKQDFNKARSILNFLRINSQRAFFTTDIAKVLGSKGVNQSDVMSNVRRWEKKGLVLVRGYRLDERQTPFKEGYIVTWVDPKKPREEALTEAIERTSRALIEKESTNPTIQRVHRIRDIIYESSKLRELVSFTYIQESLRCSKYKTEVAINRALQLYSDLKEAKLFGVFRYFYHSSLDEQDLKAAIAMKENYIRRMKGKANRIGHNWEAVAEWFIDRFTTGASFWTQNHRTSGMDRRRITLHLLKGVGGRRANAEVDRVWKVTPGIFAPTVTFVLSCKWGLVCKRDVDDFLQVLKWSKQFGVNTENGRAIKHGIVGVFAGRSFNPRENVRLKDGSKISLSSYTARMNLQLLRAADFNSKLHERGCPSKVTVQKICKIARNEGEVRTLLDAIWKDSGKSEEILSKIAEKNKELYGFERMLEQSHGDNESRTEAKRRPKRTKARENLR